MKNIILVIIVTLLLQAVHSAQLYSCIKNAFNANCKTKLYDCTNNPECSYQLHENTHHIFLNQDSQIFPPLYFSNPLARTLYQCIKTECKLPDIDQAYPKSLPFDYCLLEVYDICRGNIEEIYTNPGSSSSEAQCYRKYCKFPTVVTQ